VRIEVLNAVQRAPERRTRVVAIRPRLVQPIEDLALQLQEIFRTAGEHFVREVPLRVEERGVRQRIGLVVETLHLANRGIGEAPLFALDGDSDRAEHFIGEQAVLRLIERARRSVERSDDERCQDGKHEYLSIGRH
jgi:hypothetical protein